MTPDQFLEEIVRPNVSAFYSDDANTRHAFNAVASVDALAAQIHRWCVQNAPAEVAECKDDTYYREKLAGRNSDFRLLRDIAKAQKHVKLLRGTPQVSEANQISTRPVGWGEGPWGHGRYGGPPQVVVDMDDGTMRHAHRVVEGALSFLEDEMKRVTNSKSTGARDV